MNSDALTFGWEKRCAVLKDENGETVAIMAPADVLRALAGLRHGGEGSAGAPLAPASAPPNTSRNAPEHETDQTARPA